MNETIERISLLDVESRRFFDISCIHVNMNLCDNCRGINLWKDGLTLQIGKEKIRT